MIGFKSDTSGIELLEAKIEAFRIAAPGVVEDQIVEQVVEYAGSSRAPNGSAWPPLTAKYRRWKVKQGGQPLANKYLTGKFLASVKARNGIIAPSADKIPQGMGLEKKRVSFKVGAVTKQAIQFALSARWKRVIHGT